MKIKKENKLWFRARDYGWGWCPCSWQGWLVIFAWLVILFSVINQMYIGSDFLKNFIVILIFTIVLIYIGYKKGAKPSWHWGKR